MSIRVSRTFKQAIKAEFRRLYEAIETQTWRVVVQAPGHKNRVEKVTIAMETDYPQDFEYEAELQARLKVARDTGASIHDVKALSSRKLR
jgi:hypothetical protein